MIVFSTLHKNRLPSLIFSSSGGKREGSRPRKEAGVKDRLWTIDELLEEIK